MQVFGVVKGFAGDDREFSVLESGKPLGKARYPTFECPSA